MERKNSNVYDPPTDDYGIGLITINLLPTPLCVCVSMFVFSLFVITLQYRQTGMKTKYISDETVGTDGQLRITLAAMEVIYNSAS